MKRTQATIGQVHFPRITFPQATVLGGRRHRAGRLAHRRTRDMTERENQDPNQPKKDPQSGDKRPPSTPDTLGRLKRGSDFRDADLFDAPVEDPDDLIPD